MKSLPSLLCTNLPHRAILLGAFCIAAGGINATAATVDWIGSAGNSYTNKPSWSTGNLPAPADTATLGNSSVNGGSLVYTNALGDPAGSNALTSLLLGNIALSSGTFVMSNGSLSITNTSTTALIPGNGGQAVGEFDMYGGVLNVVRNSSTFFQDSFQPGFGLGASGTFNLYGGSALFMCGTEIGINGSGTINVAGGTLINNGWFGVARGGSSSGIGTYNQSGGTVYLLRNPGNDGGGSLNGISFCQGGTNGTVTLSGGTLYAHGMRFGQGSGSRVDWETFTMSGGDFYVGGVGITNQGGNGTHNISINISGGTFHTVNMGPNTGGTLLLGSIGTGGTNWIWDSGLPATLAASPGPGAVTFIADATRTITLKSPFSGPGALVATGPGTVVLNAVESHTGGTTVNGNGTLSIITTQTNVLGLNLASGTTLSLGNALLVENPLNMPSGTTLNFSASNQQQWTNDVTGPANLTATLGGNGIEFCSGALNHSGTTIISSGLLVVNGALTNSSSVLVTNTGALAGGGLIGSPITVQAASVSSAHLRIGSSPMNVIGTLTVSNLNLAAGSELDVKVGTSASDLLVVNGNLTLDPTAVLNVLPMQQLTPGSYTIITYTGTLTGTFNPAVGSLSRYGLSIDYSTPNQIKLVVSGSNASLTWQGTNSTWDVLTSFNWLNGAAAAQFNEGDAVTFDDTATNFTVSLTTTVYPASITINANSNYSITGSGSGRISGGTGITKNGNGTVLIPGGLNLQNDFTGPVQINAGIFKMNGGLSLGSPIGATTVASGATLDINGQGMGSEPLFLQGTGFGGTNGALMNSSGSSPGQSGGPRVITLQGDTTINSSGARFDIGVNSLGAGGGSFTGNGFNLTKIGAPDIWLHEVGDIGVGNIFINQGVLGFEYTVGMGDPTKTVTVAPGASLSLFQTVNALAKNVVLTNGSTINSLGNAGSSNVLAGAITLYGTNTISCVGSPLDLPGVISGTGAITKSGANVLRLEAANNYSGPTLVTAGRLALGTSGSIASSSLINLSSGTSLDASAATAGLSLASGQTLSGFGSLAGTVTVGAGSTVTMGTPTTPTTMVFSNNLTLNGGTCVIKLSGDASTVGGGVNDLLQVNGNLTLSGTTTIQISPTAALDATGNPYTIAQYAGTLTGGAASLHVVGSNPRNNFTVVDPATTPGKIQILVGGNSAQLVWRGGNPPTPNTWDHVATNWFNLTSSQFDQSFNGDLAIFDDSSVTNIVNVSGTNVATLVLSNNTVAYTLVGGGMLSGPVDMEGTGSLIVSLSNAPAFTGITNNSGFLVFDYPVVGSTNQLFAPLSDNGFGLNPGQGGTLIQGGSNILVLNADNTLFDGIISVTNGVLQYTNAVCLGDSATPLYATNGGTLDLNGVATGPKNIQISGAGYNGEGAIYSSGPGIANAGANNVTQIGDATIGALHRWDAFNGTWNGNGFALTFAGPSGGTVLLNNDGDTGLGDIHIVAGRLGFQGPVTMGDASKTCTVESGATLTFFSVTNANTVNGGEDKILVLNGGAVLDSGGASNSFNGPVFITGTNVIGTRSTLHILNAIMDTNGPGAIVCTNDSVGNSSGDLYLDGANTYSGPTIILVRTVFVGASSSLGSGPLVLVNNPGKLDVTALSSFSLASGQTLQGNGTVTGNSVIIGSGALLVPGTGGNNTGTLTLNSSLTLQAGSTNAVTVNKTASVANSKVSGLTNVIIGGNLVLNLAGNPLAGGDAITLFNASGTYTGGFDTISPATPGNNLVWDTSTLTTDGKLRVLSTVNTSPTNMTLTVSGGVLNITWPSDHTGWRLQSQTNTLTSTWFDVPGSTSTNAASIPIDPAQNAVFYRMVYP